MNGRARVVIVEDHALTLEGMKTALSADFDVVGEATDGVAGEALVARVVPDVAILDLGLPGLDGIALTRAIRASTPSVRIVIMTMADVEDEVVAALAAGADAYCLKIVADSGSMIDAVPDRARRWCLFSIRASLTSCSGDSCRRKRRRRIPPLTPREVEVLRKIAEGHANTEIALELNIGLGTVKGHIRDILEKLSWPPTAPRQRWSR